MLTTRARRLIAVSIACGSLAGVLTVLFLILLGRAIDAAFTGACTAAELWPALAALAALAVGRGAASWAGEVLARSAAGDVKVALRDALVAAILRRGPQAAATERTGALAGTLVGGVEAVEAWVGQYLPQAALAVSVPVLVLAVVLAIDPLSGIVLAVTGPLIPVFMYLIGDAARARTRRQFVTLTRLSARFFDAVQALPMLRAFGRAREEAAAIARASEEFRTVTLSVLRVAFLSALTLEFVATIGVAIVAVEVGLRLLYARISFRGAFTVLLLAPEFYRPLRNLGAAFHAGMAGREAIARIRELDIREVPRAEVRNVPDSGVTGVDAGTRAGADLDGATDVRAGARLEGRHPLDWRPPGVTLRGVSFAYSHAGPAALSDVDLDIRSGQTLALVGPSGAGKTTIARLLLRFLDPGEGTILVDGLPLGSWAPDEWRRRVAWVPQQPHLFHGSILENLLVARPDAPEEAVWRALEQAHADAFVLAASDGLSTQVGERGQRLSGGQAQRIALARAFLKDAPLLILDEPTAQLDPESERAVRDSMVSLRRGRSVLLVAHRLTTVVDADAIAVMRGGRVLETGGHGDLLAAGGRYAAMIAAYGGAR